MEKLKYKIIHNHNFTQDENFLDAILKANGIEDVQAFLNVSHVYLNNAFLLKNIKEGLKLFHDSLGEGKKVFIKVDCDTDGYTSSAYVRQFIEEISPETEIFYGMNYKKQHGLKYEDVQDIDGLSLIITPDSGSESDNVPEGKLIKEELNVPILVLDHHNIAQEMHQYATIINCRDGSYPNETLSGVGVVHKFFEAYCETYGLNKNMLNKYLDLVALGMIADSSDMRNLETRYYTLEGLKDENRYNGFIKELAISLSEEMKFGHTIKNYGWIIAPRINGVIRYGKPEEQLDLFRALCGETEEREYQPRRKHKDDPKPPIEIHSLQQTMARVSGNVKSRQDTEVRKHMKELDEHIIADKLDKNSVIIIDGSKVLSKSTMSGLVANKLASKYKRPIILLRDVKGKPDSYGGSARGYEKGIVQNFNELSTKTGLFIRCSGHPNAWGFEFKKDKLQEIQDTYNKLIDINQLITIHEVDFEIDANKLTARDVMSVANEYRLWGNKVSEPLFAITNININTGDINGYGENNSFIRFVYNDIAYIKKYCSKTDFEEMTLLDRYTIGKNTKQLKLTVLGYFTLNEWDNKIFPQVKIAYFDSEEVKIKSKKELTLDDLF